MTRILLGVVGLLGSLCYGACDSVGDDPATERVYVPVATDYTDPNRWVIVRNPVNWRTDATPAILNDTITVTLHPAAKVLVLEGFDGSYLPNILDILNVGDYHGVEPWLYSECLRANIRQRIRAYRHRE